MNTSVAFPLFVFEKDDYSMFVFASPDYCFPVAVAGLDNDRFPVVKRLGQPDEQR